MERMRLVLFHRWRGVLSALVLVTVAACATVSQLNIISENEEMQLGAHFATEIDSGLVFIEDPVIVGYVDSLGQALAKVSRRSHIPYTFRVVDTDEINAFAVPGGYLYVNRGLIAAADNEAELAGVIGHEIGHIVGKHGARQLTQRYGLAILSRLVLGEEPQMLAELAANILATGAIMHYSREMESEADMYGAQEVYAVGIDPQGLVTFFEKLKAMRGDQGPNAVERFLSTHPDPGDRAEAVRRQIAALPPRDDLRLDSAKFRKIRERASRKP
jgi:predicted Zn-dependent protease